MNDKLKITPKKPKGEDGYKVFSVRIKDDLAAQIEQVAQASGRSRNELIGLFLEYAVSRCEITKE